MAPNWKEFKCPWTGQWINCGVSNNGIIKKKKKQTTDTCNNCADSQRHYAG